MSHCECKCCIAIHKNFRETQGLTTLTLNEEVIPYFLGHHFDELGAGLFTVLRNEERIIYQSTDTLQGDETLLIIPRFLQTVITFMSNRLGEYFRVFSRNTFHGLYLFNSWDTTSLVFKRVLDAHEWYKTFQGVCFTKKTPCKKRPVELMEEEPPRCSEKEAEEIITTSEDDGGSPPNKKRKNYGFFGQRTRYHGITYRSLLEARTAALMETGGVPYYYECITVNLPQNIGRYTIDFYLPQEKLFLELKPCYPYAEQLIKCKVLSEFMNCRVILLYGMKFEDFLPLSSQDQKRTKYQHKNAVLGIGYDCGHRLVGDGVWVWSEDLRRPSVIMVEDPQDPRLHDTRITQWFEKTNTLEGALFEKV